MVLIRADRSIIPSLSLDHIEINRVSENGITAVVSKEGLSYLKDLGLSYEILISDIDKLYSPYRSRVISAGSRYHTYDEVQSELKSYNRDFPGITKLEVIGKSWENRDITALKISDNPEKDENEPALLYMGAHHAREWISVEVPMAIADRLLKDYGKDPKITKLVNEREFFIVPIVNPDGLQYSQFKADWRKNRRDNKDGSFGVDPNRNYPIHWGIGASNSTWSDTYKGPSIFSEPENCTIRDFALREKFTASISYHSHGNEILYPWSWTGSEQAPDHELLKDVAVKMAEFNGYDPIQSADLYPAGGESDDWLYSEVKCMAFTFELGSSFVPSETEVNGICEKNVKSALYLAERAGNLWPVFKHVPHPSTTSDTGTYKISVRLDILHNPGYTPGSLKVCYRLNNSSEKQVTCSKKTDDEYIGEIPAQNFGTFVEYYILHNGSERLPESGYYVFSVEKYNRLLVDDDNGKNYEKYLTEALDLKKIGYTLHDTKAKGTPDKDYLAGFTQVIWITGDDSSSALTDAEQKVLQYYLEHGGNLLISGQDLGYSIKSSAFYKEFLHAEYLDDNAGVSFVKGNLSSEDIAFSISGGTGASNQRYPDVISAAQGGQIFLNYASSRDGFCAASYNGSRLSEIISSEKNGDGKGAAVSYSGSYKVIYLGFGVEAVAETEKRGEFLKSCLSFLLPSAEQKVKLLCQIFKNGYKLSDDRSRLAGAAEGLIDGIIDDVSDDYDLYQVIYKQALKNDELLPLKERLSELKN